MNKFTIAVVAVLILLFGGLVVSSFLQKSGDVIDYSQYDANKIVHGGEYTGDIDEHVRGKADSEVVFIEYADLQCPGCAAVMPRISVLTKAYGDRVAFVFRNFPISGHQNARAASSAVESAGFQGYFWQMLETLYSNQSSWNVLSGSTRTDKFAELFQEIAPEGDVEKFRKDLTDKSIEKKINFDYNLGIKNSKVTGTPSFFINGEAVDVASAETQDELREKIEEKINEKLKEAGLETGGNYDFLEEEEAETSEE
jgi:protein-disulfide isomerase